MKDRGFLYVVSTPIGNLEDITLRALRILKEVDMIAAENIRRTKSLLNYYDIRKGIISYRRENQEKMAKKIIKLIKEGKNIAIVSDAGTPGISDPGSYLVSRARKEGIRTIPIPGASAISTAISVSGLPYSDFLFLGFLPFQKKKKKKKLLEFKDIKVPIMLFESPHRILETLELVKEILGNRKIVLFKELTKINEEIRVLYLEELLKELDTANIKGEYVIIIMPPQGRKEDVEEKIVVAELDTMLREGKSTKDIAKYISEKRGVPYRKVYKKCLERKKVLYGG